MNQTRQAYDYSVIELFESQVQETPEHIALTDKDTSYTYHALNERANQFAYCLQKKSVLPNDIIAILLEPGVDFIISVLAILKAGAIYVPIDTLAPQNRLADIINDATPKAIITNETFQNILHGIENDIFLIKNIWLESISYPKSNLSCTTTAASAIYMMYTSGSTGRPKGVIVPHRAVVNVAVVENTLKIDSKGSLAQFSTVAFDGSTYEIWSALLNGATLYIIPNEAKKNHIKLKEILDKHQIQSIFLPTSYLHQIIKSAPDTLDAVSAILFGGEQVNSILIKQFLAYRKKRKRPLKLINAYGPTETTVYVCCQIINSNDEYNTEHLSSIGHLISNTRSYILDKNMNSALEGELYISGANLAIGYHNCDIQNNEKFIQNPFCNIDPYKKLYKTGDKVRVLDSGDLLCLGRYDDQVKIGGFRIHLNEVEQQLMKHAYISIAAVNLEIGGGSHKILTAYLVLSSKELTISADQIRDFLSLSLPAYMLPAKYVMVDDLPLTLVGKVDKNNLDKIPHTDLSFHMDTSSSSSIEETIKTIWKHLLNRSSIEPNKNLFELGANSLLITEACSMINNELQSELQIADLLAHPTIHKLSRYLEGDIETTIARTKRPIAASDIAIIGMSCRFPKANNLQEFWDNLCQGNDCLTRFDEDQLKISPFSEKKLVPVKGVLSNIELFDASFFGFSPVDATITDPQQRVFLECAWEALEHANIAPGKVPSKTISVFAGMTDSTYLHENLLKNNWFCNEHDTFQQRIATSTSMLSTQTSYRLNLKGRSLNVNTACSTGLITVDQACQDLMMGQSDIALAGASSITVPQISAYTYQQGSIVSSDGYCRPFDSHANGTVFSNGVGVVVLKRLDDAINDNDTIYAVIKASGVNNDGQDKLGFTAPSISGQMSCIRDAMAQANVTADEISYLEAHGTATALGDVIEINALTSVYREQTDKKQFCVLGSVKGNIGHTDVTAGIAGLIKTALCLHYKKIPPMAHFKIPNPNLSLNESPFIVNTQLMNWETSALKRFAGISAFGVGGTNIHMILSDYENSMEIKDEIIPKEELILLSAKNEDALEAQVQQLVHYLDSSHVSNEKLVNIAYTLQTGREDFQWRRFSTGKTTTELKNRLIHQSSVFFDGETHHSIVFMFSGQGMQYPQMAMELFEHAPRFRAYVEHGVLLAKPYLNADLLQIICTPESKQLTQTEYAQPALFIIEYALARLLMDCGIKPDALIGHSIGEYVAACLAGVFSFEDGIALVCERGLLMANAAKGEMLALECTPEECHTYQTIANVELALHNATNNHVLAGSPENIEKLERHLSMIGKPFQKLNVSHAFHSQLMKPLEKPFKEVLSNITLAPPTIPIVSNVTGDWLSANDAISPEYWYKHLRFTVQLCKGINLLLHDKHPLFLEVGLGQALCGYVKEISKGKALVTHTLPNHHRRTTDLFQLFQSMGELWTRGININLAPIYETQHRQCVSLPTYPFQKQRYWVEPEEVRQPNNGTPMMYKSVWSHQPAYIKPISLSSDKLAQHSWIVFKDETGVGDQLISLLEQHEVQPIVVTLGKAYSEKNVVNFTINPTDKNHYLHFIQSIKNKIKSPVILHLTSYSKIDDNLPSSKEIDHQLSSGFYSLLYLTQAYLEAIGDQASLKVGVITTGTQQLLGTEAINPINATLVGSCRVIMQEHPLLKFRIIDLYPEEKPQNNIHLASKIIDSCLSELWNENSLIVPYRNGHQWKVMYGKINSIENKITRLKDNGVYMLTGGLGGMALSYCEAIVKTVTSPTFILLYRSQFPLENEWATVLENPSHKYYKKILHIRQMKTLGAEFCFYQVDISQLELLDNIIHQCLTRFKEINGLIHTAGISNADFVQFKSTAMSQDVFLPKIHGTYNLASLFKNQPLDFVVLTSSLAALLGGYRQIDYCGANSCLDSFVTNHFFPFSNFVVSINWNTWRDVGIAAETALKGEPTFLGKGNDISPKQGQALFLEILQGNEPNVAVSNVDLNVDTFIQNVNTLSEPSSNIKVARQHLNVATTYLKPQNEIESKLVYLWQEMLGIDEIGVNDDFFALGGHSLKALNLIEKINVNFNCTLSPTQIYRSPTIKQLHSTIIMGAVKKQPNILIPLKITEKEPPYLFICHPISGLTYCFNFFASQSELPMSIYGLQDPSIEANTMLYASLVEMAKDYLSAIRKIQPLGPYFLMGYSFGGNVLYEVAHLIRQEGETVALLGMIDSWAIHSDTHRRKKDFKKQLLSFGENIPKELVDLAWKRERLLVNHSLSQMNQEIILFKASQLFEDYKSIDHPTNGWSKYSKGNIVCYPIDGNHDTIIDAKNSKSILDLIDIKLRTNRLED